MAGAPPMEVVAGLSFEPFPLQTHTNDVVHGPQGWGPFRGPWTPLDFPSLAMTMGGGSGIDITYDKGNNDWRVGPTGSGQGGISLFRDRATNSVANSAPAPAFQPVGAGAATIAQGSPLQASSNGLPVQAQNLWSAFKKALGIVT